MIRGRFTISLLALLFVGASAGPAHAYLDAGTGSMILQLLLGGLAGVAVVGRLYWARVKEFFQGKKARSEAADDVARR